MPVDLHVYTRTRGILLPLRAKERQDYRFFELKRFREQLGILLNLEPSSFSVSGDLASCVTIAAKRRGLPLARLEPAMMRAVGRGPRRIRCGNRGRSRHRGGLRRQGARQGCSRR